MRYEYVRSMRLAGKLMQRGFRLYQVTKDIKNPAYDVYVFKRSSELSAAIQECSYSENGGEKDGIDIKRSRNKGNIKRD